jgi:hypothetical protein
MDVILAIWEKSTVCMYLNMPVIYVHIHTKLIDGIYVYIIPIDIAWSTNYGILYRMHTGTYHTGT